MRQVTACHVSVQDGRVVQILDNLLGNAMSFAPHGTQITFAVDLSADGNARLAVQDRGPGIPPGRLNEVFNRFYSERPPSEAFGEHSGLGLSIALQIAEGYGGTCCRKSRWCKIHTHPSGGADNHLLNPDSDQAANLSTVYSEDAMLSMEQKTQAYP